MDNNKILSRLIIGAVINFIVLYVLEQIDNRLAMLYLVVLGLMLLLYFKEQIFPNVNLLLGTIKGSVQ